MKKILTIVGARPQFVKAAVISRALRPYQDSLQEVIVHTGQHYDQNMSDVFFEEMDIPKPDINLEIQEPTHGAMTGKMLIGLEEVMMEQKPDIVLVYGDTNSTVAGALAAVKLHIPVAHVEAGMRAHDLIIPEEVNRVMTDRVSQLFFCTTEEPADNLRKEGFQENIYVTGDVMYDAVMYYKDKAEPSELLSDIPDDFYLATVHRQENTDHKDYLLGIMDALKTLAKDRPVVLPLHPRTAKYLEEYGISTDGLHILPPVGYFDMICLLKKAHMVLTDSGGLQKEAYYFSKPVVIFRHRTEWVELIDSGVAKLTKSKTSEILDTVSSLQNITSFPENIYGDGHAGDKIVSTIEEYLNLSERTFKKSA